MIRGSTYRFATKTWKQFAHLLAFCCLRRNKRTNVRWQKRVLDFHKNAIAFRCQNIYIPNVYADVMWTVAGKIPPHHPTTPPSCFLDLFRATAAISVMLVPNIRRLWTDSKQEGELGTICYSRIHHNNALRKGKAIHKTLLRSKLWKLGEKTAGVEDFSQWVISFYDQTITSMCDVELSATQTVTDWFQQHSTSLCDDVHPLDPDAGKYNNLEIHLCLVRWRCGRWNILQ